MASTTSARPSRPSFTQLTASALAAVSAAIISSTFGVAGTLIGAAVASIVASVGSTIYLASLRSTNEQLRRLAGAARRPATMSDAPTIADTQPVQPVQTAGLEPAEQIAPRTGDALATANEELPREPVASRFSWDNLRRGLPALRRRWKAVAALAIGVFAITIGTLTAVEAGTNEPVSSLFGNHGSGTSIGSVISPKKSAAPTEKPVPTPTPSAQPSGGQQTPAPTPTATPSPSVTPPALPSTSPEPGQISPSPSEAPLPGVPVPSGSESATAP